MSIYCQIVLSFSVSSPMIFLSFRALKAEIYLKSEHCFPAG